MFDVGMSASPRGSRYEAGRNTENISRHSDGPVLTDTLGLTLDPAGNSLDPRWTTWEEEPPATKNIEELLRVKRSEPLGRFIPRLEQSDAYVKRVASIQISTTLAQSALNVLRSTSSNELQDAINFINGSREVDPGTRQLPSPGQFAKSLMSFLERKVRFAEVLAELARGWTNDTRKDFAEVFKMPVENLSVMDNIVSIAILNDPGLGARIRAENTPDPTHNELLQTRRVVWQNIPPGTPLTPPYVILLAVEYSDRQAGQNIVNGILGSLELHQEILLPREAIKKLPQ